MKHTIELCPFQIPNFVRPVMPARPRQDGFQDLPGIPLSDLSDETLDAMCNEFKIGVFKKAGRPLPTDPPPQ